MQTSRLCFELPPELIAQRPAARRDRARLMVVERRGGLRHTRIDRLPALVPPGAVLVLNDTRVLHARLTGRLERGRAVRLLLLEPLPDGAGWRALARAARRLHPGTRILLPGGVTATVGAGDGHEGIVLACTPALDPAYLQRHGTVPLPPYVKRAADRADAERYQTVYARQAGSAAAPTAGLHFTAALLDRLRARGVTVATVTLHVGRGTFTPIRTATVEQHAMHRERYSIPQSTAAAIARARRARQPVVAVGTTVVRTLESAWNGAGVQPGPAGTDLFIYPGFRFRVVDQLLTNFHTPRSSLLALVCALAGEERIRDAYAVAVRRRYRLFSYGDAMLIR